MHGESGASNIKKTQPDSAILVTGATGFIGRHVVPRLVLSGKRVAILARRRGGLAPRTRVALALGAISSGIEVVDGDLAAPGSLQIVTRGQLGSNLY
jgi:uncharacterized protein YbjT (DUF2867 family)